MTALQQFALLLVGEPSGEQVAALLERCDDLVVEYDPRSHRARVLFDRHAASAVDAIVAAIRDLDSVGLRATRVAKDDDLVTLAVVAQRIGRPHRTVRWWATGRAGPVAFHARRAPHPATGCTAGETWWCGCATG